MITVDCHQHFWEYNPVRDSWIDASMERIRRDFLPNDLDAVLKQSKVDGCIAVQADQSIDETYFLLQLAQEFDFIKGVVGWVDLCSPTIEKELEALSIHKKLKGIRHIVQAEPTGFMLEPEFQHGIAQLAKYNLVYDILIYPSQLDEATQLVSKFPNQVFVLDHMGKPNIKEEHIKDWKAKIKKLAHFPNVHCKISGMVTEASWNKWSLEDFEPYLDTVFECFGPKRLLFGSDWPVCLLSAEYNQVKDIVSNYLQHFSKQDFDRIMGGNAIKIYNLTNC